VNSQPTESSGDVKFEIGHVLYIDIVGYSKLNIHEQSEQLETLKAIVRGTDQFKKAEAEGKLLRLPTGDGGALVFRTTPEAPVLCAMEIGKGLKKHPELHVRMGIHSGPVNEITDLNEQANIAGAGINIAQRVMDCGDAGHILLSQRVAGDLEHYPRWKPYLHELGEYEVKHGIRISVVNLYNDEVGNPAVAEKFKAPAAAVSAAHPKSVIPKWALIGAAILILTAIATFLFWQRAKRPTSAIQEKSIAVLPFDNQNRDPDTDYLCDGIPESIINILSELPKLKIMSRNSVFHYKGKETNAQTVGKELNVQTLLTGRVRQRGDGLTIGVELINAQDNSQMWGQQYNRKLANVFAVQEEIAKEVSDKLRLKLTGTEKEQLAKRPTENLKAFQYYMQGRAAAQRRTNSDLLASVAYFEKALKEDGKYALAYAGLSDAYANLGYYGSIAPVEGRRKAEEAARKALELDDNLAEAHVALGLVYIGFAPSNFAVGDRELRHAIELNPNLAVGHYNLGLSFIRQGRLDDATAEMAKARGLDPISSIIARAVVIPHYFKRDYSRAFELLRQANELGPPLSATWEIGLYIKNGSLDQAFTEIEKAKATRKDDPLIVYSTGMAYAAAGKKPEALQKIKELEALAGGTLNTAHWIAKIYATLNDKEMAFSWLDRGLATGALGVFYTDEPVWDPIRDDPRFVALVAKMVVPETGSK
jgi:TolB-like protein/Tfp pilus assembly protein PilF